MIQKFKAHFVIARDILRLAITVEGVRPTEDICVNGVLSVMGPEEDISVNAIGSHCELYKGSL